MLYLCSLSTGAEYDSDGFAGERCMNSALTDAIRHILRKPPPIRIPLRNTFREAMERCVDIYIIIPKCACVCLSVCLSVCAGFI